jgi:hypothetical protein
MLHREASAENSAHFDAGAGKTSTTPAGRSTSVYCERALRRDRYFNGSNARFTRKIALILDREAGAGPGNFTHRQGGGSGQDLPGKNRPI